MRTDTLTAAKRHLRRRNFNEAILCLESNREDYEDSLEFFLLLGTACLYAGDIGAAGDCFSRARKKSVTDSRLSLCYAAYFLRKRNTPRALDYYFDVLDREPNNKIAKNAIEFIRKKGDEDTIRRWADTERLWQFYPPLGVNPQKVAAVVFPCIAAVLGIVLALVIFSKKTPHYNSDRLDLSLYVLSDGEKMSPQETDLSSQSYRYILTDREIKESYENALNYFNSHRDNAAQVEINRLLHSNASVSIKKKAQLLMEHLDVPSFDTLTDNPSIKDVSVDNALYLDCYVSWGGRISNATEHTDGSYSCTLLVGYESGERIDGMVTVRFAAVPKDLAPDQPVLILGKLLFDSDDKLFVQGRAYHQSVKNGLL